MKTHLGINCTTLQTDESLIVAPPKKTKQYIQMAAVWYEMVQTMLRKK